MINGFWWRFFLLTITALVLAGIAAYALGKA